MYQIKKFIKISLLVHKKASSSKSNLLTILTNQSYCMNQPIMTSSMDDIEKCKAVAAQTAVDENIKVSQRTNLN